MWEKHAKPIIQAPGRKGCSREGKGFSVAELQDVGLTVSRAKSLGVLIDMRRRTHYPENSRMLKMRYVITFPLKEIKGVGKSAETELVRAGIFDARDLAAVDIKELSSKVKYPASKLEKWQTEAKRIVKEKLSQL